MKRPFKAIRGMKSPPFEALALHFLLADVRGRWERSWAWLSVDGRHDSATETMMLREVHSSGHSRDLIPIAHKAGLDVISFPPFPGWGMEVATMDTAGNNNLARMRNDEFVSNLVVPRSRTSP